MRRSGRLCCLLALGALFANLAACDPAMIFPRQSQPPPPSGTASPTASAPGSAANQQIRALAEKVRQLERRLAVVEQRQGAPSPPPTKTAAPKPMAKVKPPGPTPPPPSSAAPAATPSSPAAEKLYSEGLRLYQGKSYPAARKKFGQYLKSQPRGAKAAEARYYLGDSFFQEKKYAAARVEFNKMVLQHPNSILAPTALLRQAYSYQQTNQRTNFRVALQKLINTYPQSPEAQEAKRLLQSSGTTR
jgi:tol-pal system protein YbgF